MLLFGICFPQIIDMIQHFACRTKKSKIKSLMNKIVTTVQRWRVSTPLQFVVGFNRWNLIVHFNRISIVCDSFRLMPEDVKVVAHGCRPNDHKRWNDAEMKLAWSVYLWSTSRFRPHRSKSYFFIHSKNRQESRPRSTVTFYFCSKLAKLLNH